MHLSFIAPMMRVIDFNRWSNKYNDELTLVFKFNDLIGGFFAHNEHAHYYAFVSIVITGTNNNNTISGHFIIRG